MALPSHTAGARPRDRDPRGGQALLEFVIALVAILVLVAGLLQIGRLTRVQLNALNEARADAARLAMADLYTRRVPGPQFLFDWDIGPDRARHSRDDIPRPGDPGAVRLMILAHAKPDELAVRVPNNPVSNLMNLYPLIDGYALVQGRAEPRSVPLLPVMRHLIYDAEAIDIRADAWLVWTQRLD